MCTSPSTTFVASSGTVEARPIDWLVSRTITYPTGCDGWLVEMQTKTHGSSEFEWGEGKVGVAGKDFHPATWYPCPRAIVILNTSQP
mmetsp:Transcript_20442/g.34220  ORF Transcript_20442/g.34220 Transcript_20442/m.34220 type:complete len:87 (+) Transcript_20442:1239-1499(+)